MIIYKTKGGVTQTKPLVKPTLKEVSILFDKKRGYLEGVLSDEKLKSFDTNLNESSIIPPGIFQLKDVTDCYHDNH